MLYLKGKARNFLLKNPEKLILLEKKKKKKEKIWGREFKMHPTWPVNIKIKRYSTHFKISFKDGPISHYINSYAENCVS